MPPLGVHVQSMGLICNTQEVYVQNLKVQSQTTFASEEERNQSYVSTTYRPENTLHWV